MWVGVIPRFRQFHNNLLLTEDEHADGVTKHGNVRKCLNTHYYGTDSKTANSFLIGSWAKRTRVRPPRDVDLYFELPVSVYERFEKTTGNRQSAILQEVKGVLQKTYPNTDMRGDGQVVMVRFNSMSVEVAPVFKLDTGKYYFCNTHNGGNYDTADPEAEKQYIIDVDEQNNNNLRKLIRMVKAWQDYCNVPTKSFHLELLVADFLRQSEWRLCGYYFYDWLIRDFFEFMLTRVNGYAYAPGTSKVLLLGDEWQSRCQTAYNRAVRACGYEYSDDLAAAGEEWRKIFGNQIPIEV